MTPVSGLRAGLAVIAGLYGLAGVALLAAGAHAGAAHLTTAGTFLLFHAPVLLVLRLWPQERGRARLADLGALALVLGAGLFAGDLVARVGLGHALFPMAAPTGGSLTMLGWGLVTLLALLSLKR